MGKIDEKEQKRIERFACDTDNQLVRRLRRNFDLHVQTVERRQEPFGSNDFDIIGDDLAYSEEMTAELQRRAIQREKDQCKKKTQAGQD